MNMGREDPWFIIGLHQHGPGPVAKQHAGIPVRPVEQPRHGLGAHHQRAFCAAAFNKLIHHAERIDKPRANGLDIKRGTAACAEPLL